MTDSYTWEDPYTGESYTIPRFTASQTLSPQQQEIYDLGQQGERNLAQLGADQSARLVGLLDEPVRLGNEAVEARLFELGSNRLNPMFAEQEEGLRTRLANQGIQEGSRAFDRAMRGFSEGRNDAYNNLLLTGRAQANQELLTERNQPLNEISALLSGSQVSQPNWVTPTQSRVANTDVAGIIGQNYQQELARSQASNGFFGDLAGGLFSLGSAYIGRPRSA